MKKDEREEVDISISTGTMVRVVLVIAFFTALWFLRDIFLVVLTAVILASAIEPAVRFFVKVQALRRQHRGQAERGI